VQVRIGGEIVVNGGKVCPFWIFMAGFNINRAGFAVAGQFGVVWAIALGYWCFGQVEKR
jgi:high-affinity nickel-transport protein